MGDLRVRVLGGLEVDGYTPQQVGSRKARTLLKALAVAQGRTVPLDTLVDAVWPSGAPARPADQVGVLVSRLRGVLGPDRLVRGEGGYRLACDWLDVAEVEARVAEGRLRLASGATAAAGAVAGAAVALARGPLLPEDDGPWVEPARAVAERLVAEAHALRAEAALAAGDPATAAAAAGQALDRDPYDEAALRLLMRAHARAGRPASALDAYARTRALLAEELGVSPTAETEALHLAILQGSPDAARPVGPPGVPGSGDAVPVRGATLVGRDRELAWLGRQLDAVRAGGSALVAVDGEAGIGKSALVSAWAASLEDALVLVARCDPLGRDLPLQPIVDALDTHLSALPAELTDALGPDAPTGARALPSAGVALATGPGAGPGAPLAAGVPDAAAERAALFAALVAVIGRAAGGRPAVLVVDDAHLADAFTADWLRLATRRASRLLVVATLRPSGPSGLAPAATLRLGPLDRAAAARLVGEAGAEALYRRSGGHPLFLLALAASDAPGDDAGLPAAVTAVVEERLAALGDAAPTLVAAAVLGPEVDVGLLADVLARPDADLLDDLEAAVAHRALVERGSGFAFAHELVREAAAATASASRRALLHRTAARALRRRPAAEMLAVARHARLGGDRALAAEALVAAAGAAGRRGDHSGAVGLLDQAVALADGPAPRLARARARLVVSDLEGAAADAAAAVEAGAGVDGFEAAGWIAYYRRDMDAARRYADEGVARATAAELRASCLCLAGRIRESQGDLAGAGERLEAALDVATPALRPLAAIWLGSLRAHEGRPDEAADLTARGLLDRSALAHPFAVPHALIARAHALGMAGRVGDALSLTADLLVEVDARPDLARYVPAARNYRAWVLRAVGRADEAAELNEQARAATAEARMEEPYNQGTLDLADGRLLAGDPDAAERLLAGLRGLDRADIAMGWHQRERAETLAARLALAAGRPGEAAGLARSVAAGAAERGSVRHARLAAVIAALAGLADAREAGTLGLDGVEAALDALAPVAGMEAWRWTAEAARLSGAERLWAAAGERAAAFLAAVPAADRPAAERLVARWLP